MQSEPTFEEVHFDGKKLYGLVKAKETTVQYLSI